MAGRALPGTSPFAGDDGSADPALAAALARHEPGARADAALVAALDGARLLVPVLAELEASGRTEAGLHVDKEASAGVVALRAPDGRTALPVFTSTAAMAAWHPRARPVPASARRAAAACLEEGWHVLVVDAAGPVTAVVPAPAVHALARGVAWEPAVTAGAVAPDVAAAVRAALSRVAHLASVDVVPGRSAEVAVVLGVRPGLDRPALDRLLQAVGDALGGADVAARADSIELKVVAAA
ncbi:SseB family protein [Actinotalea sp. JY-7876]|uniref:SseB family protein n=1 Tax=Actinotalea sp. JY-7876 TaxID=2758442 RepID=UPI0015F3AF7F|nr:SseB family protein [Actinotalea sp. JY-7876]